MARIQISMDDSVLEKIDCFIGSAGLSRSAFLSMAALEYIKAKESAPVISAAFSTMAQLIDQRVRGEISQVDLQKQLEAIDVSVKKLN